MTFYIKCGNMMSLLIEGTYLILGVHVLAMFVILSVILGLEVWAGVHLISEKDYRSAAAWFGAAAMTMPWAICFAITVATTR